MHPLFQPHDVDVIRKAFRETRRTGSRLLEEQKITWSQYSIMVGSFELVLSEIVNEE